MDAFSGEVLHAVFSWLPLRQRVGIRRVCRQWYHFALYDVKHIDFMCKEDNVCSTLESIAVTDLVEANYVIKSCMKLESVSFEEFNFKSIEQENVQETASLISDYKGLTISCNYKQFDNDVIMMLTKNMTQLRKFALFVYRGEDSGIYLKAIDFVLSRNLNIEILHLDIRYFCVNPSFLKPLKLKELKLMSQSVSPLNSTSVFDSLANSKSSLIKLETMASNSCCNYLSPPSRLRYLGIEAKLNDIWNMKMNTLEVLDLRFVDNNTNIIEDALHGLYSLLATNRRLKAIKITNFQQLTDTFFEVICDFCTEIRCLCLCVFSTLNLTQKSLQWFLKLSKLEYLQFTCWPISDSEMAQFVRCAKSLRHLDVILNAGSGEKREENSENINFFTSKTFAAFYEKALSNNREMFTIYSCEELKNPQHFPKNLRLQPSRLRNPFV